MLELTIEASHECNLNCIHCSSKGIKGKLEPKNVKDLIDKYKPDIIRYSGGEPFLYLNEDYLTFPSIFYIVTTNGMLTTKIMNLAQYFNEIRVSIYGNSEFHDAVTGSFGSWWNATRTVRYLKEKGYNVLITSPYWNNEQYKQVLDIATVFGIKYRITGLVPYGDGAFGNSCSVGVCKCLYDNKLLVQPNGIVIHCAVEKRGFKCRYARNKGL